MLTVLVARGELLIAIAKTIATDPHRRGVDGRGRHSLGHYERWIFLYVAARRRRSNAADAGRLTIGYGRRAYVWSLFAAFRSVRHRRRVSIMHGDARALRSIDCDQWAASLVYPSWRRSCSRARRSLQAWRRSRRRATASHRDLLISIMSAIRPDATRGVLRGCRGAHRSRHRVRPAFAHQITTARRSPTRSIDHLVGPALAPQSSRSCSSAPEPGGSLIRRIRRPARCGRPPFSSLLSRTRDPRQIHLSAHRVRGARPVFVVAAVDLVNATRPSTGRRDAQRDRASGDERSGGLVVLPTLATSGIACGARPIHPADSAHG